MNKVYRTVWNEHTNTWVAVQETAKARGKSSKSGGSVVSELGLGGSRFMMTAAASAVLLMSGQVMAAGGNKYPTGQGSDNYCYYDTTSESVICGDAGNPVTNYAGTNTVDTPGGKSAKSVVLGKGAANTGESNVAIGISASSAGTSSVAVGDRAKAAANQAIAVGQNAQANGQWDVSIGRQAGWNAKAPNPTDPKGNEGRNIAIGDAALKNGLDVNNNNVMGTSAGENLKGSHNVIIGTYANAAEAIESAKANGSNDTQINVKNRTVDVLGGGTKAVNHVETANSVAIGTRALTTKAAGVAIGQQAKAFGNTSSAVGNGSRAVGDNSVAMGNTANAGATGAIAIGQHANYDNVTSGLQNEQKYKTTGANSVAIGTASHAQGTSSVAVGHQAVTTPINSIAVGFNARAVGTETSSISIGENAYSDASGALVIGKNASARGAGVKLANGQDNASPYNAIAIGTDANVDSIKVAPGGNQERSTDAIAIGTKASANYASTIAIGQGARANTKSSATAIGLSSNAEGWKSLAVGVNSVAKLTDSVALGTDSVADVALGAVGSDPLNAKEAAADSHIWKSTKAAVSIGNVNARNTQGAATPFTRQITGLAAGTQDTDAVNVAQLKAAGFKLDLGGGVTQNIKNGDTLQLTAGNGIGLTYDAANGGLTISSTGSGVHFYDVNGEATDGNYNNDGATGKNALAAGVNTVANGVSTIAIGEAANAHAGSGALAIGSTYTGTNLREAVLDDTQVEVDPADPNRGTIKAGHQYAGQKAVNIAEAGQPAVWKREVNESVKAWSSNAIAIGAGAEAGLDQNDPTQTNAGKTGAVAVGTRALAYEVASVALGEQAGAFGKASVALGTESTANNINGVAVGSGATAEADNTVAVGFKASADGTSAVAVGDNASTHKTANQSMALGNLAKTNEGAVKGVAIGYKAEAAANIEGAVALGAHSIADRAKFDTTNTPVTAVAAPVLANNQVYVLAIADQADKDAVAATAKDTLGAVSLGSAFDYVDQAGVRHQGVNTRQIMHVAAGTEDSDAVNVAQLKAVANKFATTPLTVTDGKVTAPAAGSAEAGKLATAGDIANAINNSGFTLTTQGEPTTASLVNPGETVDLSNDDGNIIITKGSGDNNVNFSLADTVKIGPAANPITINGTERTISGLVANLPVTTSTGTPTTAQLAPANPAIGNAATVGDVLNAGWNLQVGGAPTDFVRPYDTVNFVGANGATVTTNTDGAQTTITIGMNAQGQAESAQLPVVYTDAAGQKVTKQPDGKFYLVDPATGLPTATEVLPADVIASMQGADGKTVNAPVKLANVAPGVNDTDAVNVSQLKGAAAALGGGAGINPDGSFKAPSYTLTDGNPSTGGTKAYTTVGDALGGLNTAVNQPLTITGNTNNDTGKDGSQQKLGSTLNISGGLAAGKIASNSNIRTVVTDGKVDIQLADAPTFTGTVTAPTFVASGAKPVTIDGAKGTVSGLTDNLPATSNGGANPTKRQAAPTQVTGNNAATVNDVLNAGWNLEANGQAADFVKAYDTVNFTGGKGVTVKAEATPNEPGKTNIVIDVNAQNLAETAQLPVVYTKADGSKVYKHTDGNFYDKPEGTAGAKQVQPKDIIASMQGADGKTVNAPVKLANVAPGVSNTDAVNVSQLKGAAAALGGGAGINPDGSFKAPSYSITNPANGAVITAGNVGDAVKALNTAVNNPLTFVGDTGSFNRNLGQTTAVKGGATGKLTEGNIGVSADPRTNTLNVKLAENINLGANGSVKMGDTTVNNGGLTIAGGPSVTKAGIDAGGKVISGVANGVKPTDAVNVSQLQAAQAASTTKVAAGKNINVAETTNADGSKTYTVATNDQVDFTKATVGGVVVDGATNKISGLADGVVNATSTEAVNGSQLFNLGDSTASSLGGTSKFDPATGKVTAGLAVGGTTHNTVQDALNAINTTAGKRNTVSAGTNIVVTPTTANGVTNYQVATNPNMTLTSVTTTDAAGNQTVTNGNGVTITPQGKAPVSLTGDGLNNGGNKITNVAEGTAGTDAVNVDQLNTAIRNAGNIVNQDFGQRIDQLNGRLDQVENTANAGVAQAIATAGLPQAYLPGKSMVAVGGGYYKGETGYAVGFSTISDGGNWIIKGTASGNSRGHFGASVGAGYQW